MIKYKCELITLLVKYSRRSRKMFPQKNAKLPGRKILSQYDVCMKEMIHILDDNQQTL